MTRFEQVLPGDAQLALLLQPPADACIHARIARDRVGRNEVSRQCANVIHHGIPLEILGKIHVRAQVELIFRVCRLHVGYVRRISCALVVNIHAEPGITSRKFPAGVDLPGRPYFDAIGGSLEGIGIDYGN